MTWPSSHLVKDLCLKQTPTPKCKMFNLKNHLGVQLQLQGEGIPSYSVQHFFRQLMLFCCCLIPAKWWNYHCWFTLTLWHRLPLPESLQQHQQQIFGWCCCCCWCWTWCWHCWCSTWCWWHCCWSTWEQLTQLLTECWSITFLTVWIDLFTFHIPQAGWC